MEDRLESFRENLESIQTDEARERFLEHGVCILDAVLHLETLAALQNAVDALKEESEKSGELLYTDGNIRVGKLLRAKPFESFITDKMIHSVVSSFVGATPVLSSYSAHIVMPSTKGMGSHRDWPYFALPDSVDFSEIPSLSLQVLIALDDFTWENGATIIAPGSHRYNRSHKTVGAISPNDFELFRPRAVMPAGSVMIFHGAIIHGVAENRSHASRTSIIAGFVPYWVRPMRREFGESEEFRNSDIGKSLLGLDFRARVRADLQKIGYGVAKPEQK